MARRGPAAGLPTSGPDFQPFASPATSIAPSPVTNPFGDWLKSDVPEAARKTIGGDIKTVQARWPIDEALVDQLAPGPWKVRSTHDKVEHRVIFMLDGSSMVLLHGFTKNSAKTKKADIDLANKRKAIWEKGQ